MPDHASRFSLEGKKALVTGASGRERPRWRWPAVSRSDRRNSGTTPGEALGVVLVDGMPAAREALDHLSRLASRSNASRTRSGWHAHKVAAVVKLATALEASGPVAESVLAAVNAPEVADPARFRHAPSGRQTPREAKVRGRSPPWRVEAGGIEPRGRGRRGRRR